MQTCVLQALAVPLTLSCLQSKGSGGMAWPAPVHQRGGAVKIPLRSSWGLGE